MNCMEVSLLAVDGPAVFNAAVDEPAGRDFIARGNAPPHSIRRLGVTRRVVVRIRREGPEDGFNNVRGIETLVDVIVGLRVQRDVVEALGHVRVDLRPLRPRRYPGGSRLGPKPGEREPLPGRRAGPAHVSVNLCIT